MPVKRASRRRDALESRVRENDMPFTSPEWRDIVVWYKRWLVDHYQEISEDELEGVEPETVSLRLLERHQKLIMAMDNRINTVLATKLRGGD